MQMPAVSPSPAVASQEAFRSAGVFPRRRRRRKAQVQIPRLSSLAKCSLSPYVRSRSLHFRLAGV